MQIWKLNRCGRHVTQTTFTIKAKNLASLRLQDLGEEKMLSCCYDENINKNYIICIFEQLGRRDCKHTRVDGGLTSLIETLSPNPWRLSLTINISGHSLLSALFRTVYYFPPNLPHPPCIQKDVI